MADNRFEMVDDDRFEEVGFEEIADSAIPGTELTGLPGPPKPPVPRRLQPGGESTWQHIKRLPGVGAGGSMLRGNIRAGAGMENLASGRGDWRQNVIDISQGVGPTGSLLGAAIAPAAIPEMVFGMASSPIISKGASYTAEKLGADPKTAELAGEVGGWVGPTLATMRGLFRPRLPQPKPSVPPPTATAAPPPPPPSIPPPTPPVSRLPVGLESLAKAETELGPAAAAVPNRLLGMTPYQRKLETDLGPAAMTLPSSITRAQELPRPGPVPDLPAPRPEPRGYRRGLFGDEPVSPTQWEKTPPQPTTKSVPGRPPIEPKPVPTGSTRTYIEQEYSPDVSPLPKPRPLYGEPEVVAPKSAYESSKTFAAGPEQKPVPPDAGPVPKGTQVPETQKVTPEGTVGVLGGKRLASEAAGPISEKFPPIPREVPKGYENIQEYRQDVAPPKPETFKGLKPSKKGERGAALLPFTLDDIKSGAIRANRAVMNEMVDRFYPIHEMEQKVVGSALTEAERPYMAARNYQGIMGRVRNRLDGLSEILRSTKDDGLLDQAKRYAMLERYNELAGRGVQEFPGKLTPAQIQAEMTALETSLGPANLQKVQNFGTRLRAWSKSTLDDLHQAGIIGDDAYKAILANNEKYMPMQRLAKLADELDDPDSARFPNGSNVFSVSGQNVIYNIDKHGSTLDVADPIESLVRNLYKAVPLAERNRVAKAAVDMSRRPEYRGIIEPVGPQGAKPDGYGTFAVLIDGKKHDYYAPREFVDSLKGLDRQSINRLDKMARFSSEALKKGATTLYSPFIISNLFRDYQNASVRMASKGHKFTPMTWMEGLASAFKKDDYFRRWLESGGSQSGFFESSRSIPKTAKQLTEGKLKRAKRAVLGEAFNPLHFVQLTGELVEQAPRLGAFRKALEKGMSDKQAALLSRDVTVDFARSGNTMRLLSMWVPFVNARLQGSLNTMDSLNFASNPKGAARASLMVGALVGLPALYTYAHNQMYHKKLYDEIAESEKENYFIYIYGDKVDEKGNLLQAVKIPKGDVGRIFGNPLEEFLDWLNNKQPKAFKKMAMQIMSDISPVSFEREGEFSTQEVISSAVPPIGKAAIETAFNVDTYTGGQIVPRTYQEASPEEQYKSDTPEWLVESGKATGVAPLKLQHAMGTLFGGVGRAASQAKTPSDWLKVPLGGETFGRRFLQARGGASRERGFEMRREARRDIADLDIRLLREAESMTSKLDSLPPDQQLNQLRTWAQESKSGSLNPKVFEKAIDLYEERLGIEDPLDRALRADKLEVRSLYILRYLNTLPAESRIDAMKDLAEHKVLTPRVLDMMEAMAGSDIVNKK